MAGALGASFCYELHERSGGAETDVRLGRDPRSELLINDATVSRQQLILSAKQGSWTARRVAKSAAAKYAGQNMSEEPVHLVNGGQIQLGQVTLTFYDADGMVARLKSEPKPKPR